MPEIRTNNQYRKKKIDGGALGLLIGALVLSLAFDIVSYISKRSGGGGEAQGSCFFYVLILVGFILYFTNSQALSEWLDETREKLSLSPLHRAVIKGDRESVRNLLREKTIRNKKSRDGSTALHYAVHCAHPELIPQIAEFIDVDAQDRNGKTALHVACGMGALESVRQLLKSKASIEIKDGEKATPLYRGVEGGNAEIVKLLIDRGADVAGASEGDTSALHCAAGTMDPDDAKELEARDGMKSLPGLADGSMLKIALLLIDHGSPINAVTDFNETPLHFAVDEENLRMVKLLVERGASLDVKNRNGETALYLAAEVGELAILHYLVEAGAGLEESTDEGITPLHIAADSGPEMVEFLLKKGAAIDAKDGKGKSPLHYAVHNLDSVKVLIRHGADPRATDSEGKTPLDVALQQKEKEIAEYLGSLEKK
jgi:ankyrin repeat protein